MKLVMVDMKKAIAKCSHEDAPELSLPPYRSAYRFTNTMINKGDQYENINDMATMFAKMMSQMKRNRNSYTPYSSYSGNSHHVRQDDVPDEEEPQLLHPIQLIQRQLTPRKLQHGQDEDDDEDDEDEQHDERQPGLLVFFLQLRRCLRHVQRDV